MHKTLWNMENASESAKGIQFWRSEYFKRSFMQAQEYQETKDILDDIKKKWELYIQDSHPEYSRHYSKDYVRHLQSSCLAYQIKKHYADPERDIDFSIIFKKFIDTNFSIIGKFNWISYNYDYCVDALCSPVNMEDILTTIDNALPDPPYLFLNKHYHQAFPEHVLTLLRLNEKRDTKIRAPQASSWFEVLNGKYDFITGDRIHVGEHTRYADFAILGQALHPNFDFELAVQEIKDHIIWTIYETKSHKKIPLTDAEEQAYIDLYKRMALGEYGPTHKAARAIGLWLWDECYTTKCTESEAIRRLRAQNLDKEHSSSSDRSIRRLLKNAQACISEQKVVAVEGKSGRPKKCDKVSC